MSAGVSAPVFRYVARRSISTGSSNNRSLVGVGTRKNTRTRCSTIHSSSSQLNAVNQEESGQKRTRRGKRFDRNKNTAKGGGENGNIQGKISMKGFGKALKKAMKDQSLLSSSAIKAGNSVSDSASPSCSTTLAKCNEIMDKLLVRRSEFTPPPIDWLYSDPIAIEKSDEIQARLELYRDAVDLAKVIELSIQSKRLKVSSGRENRDLTSILGNLLLICSETPPRRLLLESPNLNLSSFQKSDKQKDRDTYENIPSTTNTCTKLLDLIQTLNFDIQPIHHFCAIRAANQEHEWEASSKLFLRQIDPDYNGLVPVDPTLGWDGHVEMGLFGIAMQRKSHKHHDAQHQQLSRRNSHVVDGMLRAVRDMCMVSPTDQEKYVLAAGSALGLAGEWKSCVEYLENDPKASDALLEFGQPLYAAFMNACYINGEFDMVHHLYHHMIYNPEMGGGGGVGNDEWQWGGEFTNSHPLCIDLMMRAMDSDVGMYTDLPLGSADDDGDQGINALSQGATSIFRNVVENGGNITLDAIKGVLRTCENDKNFEKAMDILQMLQKYDYNQRYGNNDNGWAIVGESAENFLYKSEPMVITDGNAGHTTTIDGDILSSIMRTCNSAGEYGLSLICLRLTRMGDSNGEGHSHINMDALGGYGVDIPQNIVKALLTHHPLLYESKDLLHATSIALSGLQCTREASHLEAEVTSEMEQLDKTITLLDNLSDADTRATVGAVSWREAYRQIDRLLCAADVIKRTNCSLSKIDEYHLSLAVATMLRYSIECGQYNAGIMVAQNIANIASSYKTSSMKDTVKSFLGLDNDDDVGKKFWGTSDELLATMIQVYSHQIGTHEALMLFFEEWEKSGSKLKSSVKGGNSKESWIKSCNIALKLLFKQGNIDRARVFFDAIHPTCRTAETYLIMARGYARLGKWKDVGVYYADAKRNNCLSERLALLAMEDISKSTVSGKIKILRKVPEDMAKLKDIKAGAWISDNYWELKRRLGFHYTRLLMWWNDPSETQARELRLASQHLNSCMKRGVAPHKDSLVCIINQASAFEVFDENQSMKEKEEPASLIFKALVELCCRHDAAKNERLVAKGVKNLVYLNAQQEIDQFFKFADDNGIDIDKQNVLSKASKRASSDE